MGDKCGQLSGMHALPVCDTVSYPYGKDKKSALKVLVNDDIDGLQDALGEPDISQGQLKAPALSFWPYVHEPKEATTAKEATTDSQQPATIRAASPSPTYALEGSI